MMRCKVLSLLVVTVITEGQVIFPSDLEIFDVCTTSDGQRGLCYEFRSAEFKNCTSFFPSTDSNDQDVADHLNANRCKNTGKELYFCCPSSNSIFKGGIIPKDTECGTSVSDNAVFGTLTKPGEWPWLASIGFLSDEGYVHICGGTLITKQHVISAAHCFTPKNREKIGDPKLFVRLGEYDVHDDNDTAEDFDIVAERMHDFDNKTKEDDIILLKLDSSINVFTDRIRPACLPYHLRNENFEGEKLQVVGWGIFNNTIGKTAPVPYLAVVPVVPAQECLERYQSRNKDRKIDNRQLCAGEGGANGTPDSCKGDSGGPLNFLDVNTSRFYVVGAVSFGPKICGFHYPGVYARIGYYLDWIEENIRQLL